MQFDTHISWGGLEHLPVGQRIQFGLIAAMLVGQVAFVLMWAMLPWWREWIGRALMAKSAALLILLALTLVNAMIVFRSGPYPYMEQVTEFGDVLVVAGIWTQVVALAREVRLGNTTRSTYMAESNINHPSDEVEGTTHV